MTNDDLDMLLKLLRQLSQTMEESAIDYAFLAVTTSTEYTHIRELLTFCSQCHTADEELRENLERLKYGLEGYCLLFGDAASFGRDSYWHSFWMGDNHWELFVKMLEEAKIQMCSLLWSRYRDSMAEHLMENVAEFFPTLLKYLERTVVGKHAQRSLASQNLDERARLDSAGVMSVEVSNFMEKDLLPPFFTKTNVEHLVPWQDELMAFFVELSLSLWQLDQAHYPQNALQFASTFFRVVNLQLTRNGEAAEKVRASDSRHFWIAIIIISSFAAMDCALHDESEGRRCRLHIAVLNSRPRRRQAHSAQPSQNEIRF